MIRRSLLALLLAAAVPCLALHAQEPSSDPGQAAPGEETPPAETAAPRPDPCAAEPFRQFDFWLGDWDVHGARGGPPGRNVIESLHNGCVVRESYRGGRSSGMSMNYYDRSDGTWHQLWVGSGGLVLRLEGGWNGESMVLSNEVHRISWTPADDGTVRQLWEQTEDGGATWTVVFDGTYIRRSDG